MVLLFKGIAPPSQFPATIGSGAPPTPNHAVFKAELAYVSKPFGGARGGEGVCTTCTTSFSKKKVLSAYYVPTMYITIACSGVIKDKGDKIRIGGAHKWAEMLHHPCILGGPQKQGGENQNWWGPQVGGNATSPVHSRGSAKTRGTKSELVGPTSGRKCYITPAFSGIPEDKGDKIRIDGAHKWAEMLHHQGG